MPEAAGSIGRSLVDGRLGLEHVGPEVTLGIRMISEMAGCLDMAILWKWLEKSKPKSRQGNTWAHRRHRRVD